MKGSRGGGGAQSSCLGRLGCDVVLLLFLTVDVLGAVGSMNRRKVSNFPQEEFAKNEIFCKIFSVALPSD